ncbi:MAG: hypothetical protein ACKVP5_01940 [Aestuariivirga sp.]
MIAMQFILPPAGEGGAKRRKRALPLARYARLKHRIIPQNPHPALRATFSRWEKGEAEFSGDNRS